MVEGYSDGYLAEVLKQSMQQGYTLAQSVQALLDRGISKAQADRAVALLQPVVTKPTNTPATTASITPLLLAAAAAYFLGQ